MTDEGMPPIRLIDARTEHTINNHLAIIIGFSDLLLAETDAADPRYEGLQELNRSARELVALFRRIPRA